jgi:BlaI family transcriptional regulator, penicillinase repressor
MRPRTPTLTAQELELMKIVWELGAATVRQVYEELVKRRKIAYTTVMSGLKTLEQKGYLRANQQDRAYIYEPTRPQNQVIRGMVREFVERVFGGSAKPLLMHLLDDQRLSESDLLEISRMKKKQRKKP